MCPPLVWRLGSACPFFGPSPGSPYVVNLRIVQERFMIQQGVNLRVLPLS